MRATCIRRKILEVKVGAQSNLTKSLPQNTLEVNLNSEIAISSYWNKSAEVLIVLIVNLESFRFWLVQNQIGLYVHVHCKCHSNNTC